VLVNAKAEALAYPNANTGSRSRAKVKRIPCGNDRSEKQRQKQILHYVQDDNLEQTG